MRLFFAFPLSDAEKGQIGECIASGKNSCPDLKWVKPENIHLTLHFLGDLDSDKASSCVRLLSHPAIDDFGFTVEYKGFGRFPTKGIPRVYFISLTAGMEECGEFHAQLGELLRPVVSVENRPFTPHITVARVKGKHAVYPDVRKLCCPAGTIFIRGLVLYESILQPHGSVYREIARKDLKVKSIT